MINETLKISILNGFIPQENDHIFHCIWWSDKKPSEIELELASHDHRWKVIREQYKKFLRDIHKELVEFESEMLKLFGLPDIDEIRNMINEGYGEDGNKFDFDRMDLTKYKELVKDLQYQLIGQKELEKQKDEEKENKLRQNLAFIFAGAAKHNSKRILKAAEAVEMQDIIAPILAEHTNNITNEYFNEIYRNAEGRLKRTLNQRQWEQTKKYLLDAAQTGEGRLKVGRKIHNAIGEGDLWRWNRFARSESTLGVNANYNYLSDQSGVKYDKWQANFNACMICSNLDGQIWERGQGPEPVTYTHPHCLCLRVPYFRYEGRVNKPWTRPTPYENPYSAEERENISQWL